MNCFSLITAADAVCRACGAAAEKMSARDYREKLIRALYHPLVEVRMRAVIALGLCGEPDAAAELVQCALRHPTDVTEGVEIVRSLQKLQRGLFRTAALRMLLVQHPASPIREAALRVLANG